MNTCKVGVVGVGRGSMIFRYCKEAQNAKLVAICDKWEGGLEKAKKTVDDDSVTYYTDYTEFLKHDMDVVLLANYATEHAPFAIAAMKAGKHVISEVLPAHSMAQAVALAECVEETGKIYCYAENYCFMAGPREMRRKFLLGDLGEFEYAEGEYMHNCEPIWPDITHGDPEHWRNNISAFFYCTHSLGPLLHISGQRPVKVVGLECPFNARMARMGSKGGSIAVELVTLENGAVVKSLHGLGCSKNSIWYTVYGSKGRLETAREDAVCGGVSRLYQNLDEQEGVSCDNVISYFPKDPVSEKGTAFGHGGSDYVCLYNAFDYICGNKDADVIDVYEALDMWLPGFWGYISVLNGGVSQDIPNLRDKQVRDLFRNDHRCTDPKAAGDQLLPCYSKGNPDIDPAIYERCAEQWKKKQGG